MTADQGPPPVHLDALDPTDLDERIALLADLPREYGRLWTVLDPCSIKLKRHTQWPEYLRQWPLAVCWGDWDAAGPGDGPFREEMIETLLRHGGPYRRRGRYREMITELGLQPLAHWVNCDSPDEIEAYLARIFELQERIIREGYRPRRRHGAGREITVRVGRDGSFTKCGQGTHRLAIARLLGLPSVPVVVDLAHWDWAVRCARTRRGRTVRQALEEELAEIAAGKPTMPHFAQSTTDDMAV